MLKRILKRILYVISNFLVFLLSILIPKTEGIIVVGSWFGKRFADNSKYFFLYVNQNKSELGIEKVIWITRNRSIKEELRSKGFDAYMAWSIYSIWYHLRAKIHVIDQHIDDINPFFSVNCIRVNLWHGFPLKKIGSFANKHTVEDGILDNKKFIKYVDNCSRPGCWGNQFVLATSAFAAEILGEAFKAPREKVIVSGYPRNYESIIDNPINCISQTESFYLKLIKEAKEKGNLIIAYFPTFRDTRDTLFFGTENNKEILKLLEFFKKSNITLISKYHFASKTDKYYIKEEQYTFINLEPETDIYTFLSEVDILITDYSSIFFDFLLWNKPIIFFPYDFDYYTKSDRGLIFDYDKYTPGPKVYNIGELISLLERGVGIFYNNYGEKYGKQSKVLSRKIFGDFKNMEIKHLIQKLKELSDKK